MANNIDAAFDTLAESVTALEGAVASTVAIMNGFQVQLQAAMDAGRALGMTDEQMARFTQLDTAIDTHKDALAAAAAAHPAPPTP